MSKYVCLTVSSRVSKKMVVSQSLSNGDLYGGSSSSSEDSDDSVVGEHSPFVKHTAKKRYVWLCAWMLHFLTSQR